ncbi:tRNA uridine-5-carboxymethylaminomethyl(34) synthesis GTPase MnmE [Chitinivorax sp. B]|uniref:tRNA uridine-5-carboxymethylaminomethyl(34) synthesis GTPase MnmE n=1 Tax=Chitinivorax sp. B TaxID=2502235 RepID=UPI0010F4CBFA|nr:tRNA uridine-5-carboxymethylaminomethyl(34) synthesis GTPase MnmE [Chitinivorax sp. B]
MLTNDTIAAIATAPGRGGVGVIRISGPATRVIAEQMLGKLPTVRMATFARFRDAAGDVLDEGIALFFAGPNSFTGEDILELQGHGGPIVLRRVLAQCVGLGARIAEPGEFTKRAFLNDKLDLAQAEAVADLIDASSEEAARSAMRSLRGEFSGQVRHLVDQVIHLRMLVEATLDFPEEDVDFLQTADALGKLKNIQSQLAKVRRSAKQGSILREGLHVVLVGQPNVGKSSLMNALAGEDVAIVTDIAGTTRDAIREQIHIDGVPLHIIDTAGLRETTDQVELIGIDRTWQAIEKADIALLLVDARHGLTEAEQTIMQRFPDQLRRLKVFNKIDLSGEAPCLGESNGIPVVYLSAKRGHGIDLLRAQLLAAVGFESDGQGVFMARERHLDAIRRAAEHLGEAEMQYQQIELFAEELRLTQNALNEITGEFTADDLLGEIFSRFCIGK